MKWLLIGGTDILFAWLSGFAVSLSAFINAVEDGVTCRQCGGQKDCFARRRMRFRQMDYLEEWMFVSFWKMKRQCPYISRDSMLSRAGCSTVAFLIFLLPLWSGGTGIRGVLYGIAAAMLFLLSVVDWRTQYIPLECNVIIFLCGLIHLFADFSNWVDYLIGLFAVSGFLLFVDRIFTPVLREKYQGEAKIEHVIGDGDIKLMAATGLLLGWQLNFLALGIGCVAGSVIHLVLMKIRKADRQFAFGPYLSLGVYITMICGEQLVSWYLNMMGVTPY